MFPSPFQSAHPLRGATSGQLIKIAALHISIHAPLTGCDSPPGKQKRRNPHFNPRTPRGVRHVRLYNIPHITHFNPRTPRGVRPPSACQCWRSRSFQSTHPSRGATVNGLFSGRIKFISIHAPLAGCDDNSRTAHCLPPRHFNPRTPRGVRLREQNFLRFLVSFQSTHPSRGATLNAMGSVPNRSAFQSTHPLRGATLDSLQTLQGWTGFQSTHPLRGATKMQRHYYAIVAISIHAPLTGCDLRIFCSISSLPRFQSTHPLRGATLKSVIDYVIYRFQSTHPLRGATAVLCISTATYNISIHAPLAGCPFFPGGIPTHRRRRTHPVSGKKCAYPG